MFGNKKAQLLEAAEAKIKLQQERLDWYQRHFESQQAHIEELYDVVSDLSRQLGMVLKSDNIERLQKSSYLEENSNFFLDLYLLFNARFRKGKNISSYYGRDLDDIKRKFQDRDFKNSALIHLTERLTLDDLRTLFKDGLWRKSLKDMLLSIRIEKQLDTKQQ